MCQCLECVGGPLAGRTIETTANSGTLEFTLHGQTGRYVQPPQEGQHFIPGVGILPKPRPQYFQWEPKQ